MTSEETRPGDEVILGSFTINDMPTRVLFDASASKIFCVSYVLCSVHVTPKSSRLCVRH